jgi:hypothetical protein
VRLVDFWDRMNQTFGPSYARSWASDQRLAALAGRTVSEALEAGMETRDVWRAVCASYPVPKHLS